MKIRETRLQKENTVYKTGNSLTKQDFHLQNGNPELLTGLSGCYLPWSRDVQYAIKNIVYKL